MSAFLSFHLIFEKTTVLTIKYWFENVQPSFAIIARTKILHFL